MIRRCARASGRLLVVGLLVHAVAAHASAQELADFDYENLSYRGLGAHWGYLWSGRVDPTPTYGVRMDLGYLGPGLRVVPGITYWSSQMKAREVAELERRVEELIDRQDPGGAPASVDLGTIDWSDLMLSLDGHVVWRLGPSVLTFAGVGAAAHLLNGAGEAVADTFVEDLLDSVTAGANLHAGVELPLTSRLRTFGMGRLEVLGDLQYFELRLGAQLMSGGTPEGDQTR